MKLFVEAKMDNAVAISRWIIGGGLLTFGAIVGLGNWTSFISTAFNKSNTSFVFIFGIAAMVAGIFIMPPNPLRSYWWGAFIIDFSAGPLWLLMVLKLIFGSNVEEKNS